MTQLRFLDGFCGAGGATEGMIKAGATVMAAINHNEAAITAHGSNHPGILHLNDDIRKVNPKDLLHLGINAIWMSAECTHFSSAKGGQSREADSRMLSDEASRFAKVLEPDYIIMENVKEFLTWGPLRKKLNPDGTAKTDAKGNEILEPDPKYKGREYFRWVRQLQEMGYTYEYRILNAADYGAYQQRKRYFGIFAKNGLPIVWPRQTHHKKPPPMSGLLPWKPVREILDLDNRGKSLLTERDPLQSDATITRIESGLNRYGHEFIQAYYSSGGKPESNVASLDTALGTVTTKDRFSLCTVLVDHKGTGGRNCAERVKGVNEPMLTVITGHHPSVVTAELIDGFNHNSPQVTIDRPLSTVLAGREPYLFITFLAYSYSGSGQISSIEAPVGAITTVPKSNLVHCIAAPGYYTFKRYSTGAEIPADHRVVNGYLISNNILDIRMRPLTVTELARAQGFPDGYRFHPTNMQKSKYFIGNAVHTLMSELLVGGIQKALANASSSSITKH